jgi:crotonobetainyl-CoA:carnitine CoA-transferase CaiB-like acyl-CoA transferase
MLITSPNLPSLPLLDIETSLGKRTTQLDLDSLTSAKENLRDLIKDAHVFLQAYRPGGLESRGFGVDDVVSMKEGGSVIYANLRAWGWDGPWASRRGVSIPFASRFLFSFVDFILVV